MMDQDLFIYDEAFDLSIESVTSEERVLTADTEITVHTEPAVTYVMELI